MSETTDSRIVDLLAEQLRLLLTEPDVPTRAAREAGFWRGAVKGLCRNYGDSPATLVAFLFAANSVYSNE